MLNACSHYQSFPAIPQRERSEAPDETNFFVILHKILKGRRITFSSSIHHVWNEYWKVEACGKCSSDRELCRAATWWLSPPNTRTYLIFLQPMLPWDLGNVALYPWPNTDGCRASLPLWSQVLKPRKTLRILASYTLPSMGSRMSWGILDISEFTSRFVKGDIF